MTKKTFDALRKSGKYTDLGWMFWNGFVAAPAKKRKQLLKFFDSLSAREKKLCEQI